MQGGNCTVAASKLPLGVCCMNLLLQVGQILNLRTDLMEAAEKLRRSEAERQTLETDITSLRQQVCSWPGASQLSQCGQQAKPAGASIWLRTGRCTCLG